MAAMLVRLPHILSPKRSTHAHAVLLTDQLSPAKTHRYRARARYGPSRAQVAAAWEKIVQWIPFAESFRASAGLGSMNPFLHA